MSTVKFTNKSNTLRDLKHIIKKSKILPQCYFTVGEYQSDNQTVIKKIDSFCKSGKYIVRSSSLVEDSLETSKAGMFLSVPNVSLEQIGAAIEKVIKSFDNGSSRDIVFIQPMLDDVEFSGVAFTINPNNQGNYYVINYDDSGSTDSVTSGTGTDLKTYYLFKNQKCSDKKLKNIICAVKELEDIFDNIPLDIEFAVSQGQVYIFQVRPLVNKIFKTDYSSDEKLINLSRNKLESILGPKPNICGKTTILSVMTDWNPAEMIGIHPKPLALSLYKRLITDREWAYQRNNYGYRDMRSFPLMVDFCGYPYIDARISFNSFIPADLENDLSSKLVDYYIETLAKSPEKHDKVEFDIIFSCYTFDLPEKVKVLLKNGFDEDDLDKILSSLRNLTNNIIGAKEGLWKHDLEKIDILEKKRNDVLNSSLDDISKIYWLLEDCGRYGTLPFAGLARAGFVAVQLLRSLVNINILSESDYQKYMANLNTISSQMAKDRNDLSTTAFIKKYGHLRPGTYDITADRYDVAPDKYFSNMQTTGMHVEPEQFTLSLDQYRAVDETLKNHGLKVSVLELFDFIKNGIEGREYSKFVFTKNVSAVLEILQKIGKEHNLSRDDMSFMDISIINELYCSSFDISELIFESIQKGKHAYSSSEHLSFPPVLMQTKDLSEFYNPTCIPNYITTKFTTGQLVKSNYSGKTVSEKIILIDAADPGFDWIFSYPIKGFITKYGGANSHMAIRAGELEIPAVIGVGEQIYSELQNTDVVTIDCSNHKIEMIK